MLSRKGADPIVSAEFYCAVVHEVLIFGVETWVSTAATMQKLEGFHVSFLRHETGMKARRLGDENWRNGEADRVLQAEGTKPLR